LTETTSALVDLNAHLLPEVEEGLPSTEEALARVREAYADGVRVLYAVASPGAVSRVRAGAAHRRLRRAVEMARLDMEIDVGHQAALHEQLAEDFARGRILPLGSSGYVFVELPDDDFPSYTLDVLYRLSLEGARVLLIHPEKNYGLQRNAALVRKLRDMEVVGVAAAFHLRRTSPRELFRTTLSLIEAGLVQAVASYAGATADRPARLSDVAPVLIRAFGDAVAGSLLLSTPRAIRAGLPVEMRMRTRRPLVSWFT